MRVCQFRHFGSEAFMPPEDSRDGEACESRLTGCLDIVAAAGNGCQTRHQMRLVAPICDSATVCTHARSCPELYHDEMRADSRRCGGIEETRVDLEHQCS